MRRAQQEIKFTLEKHDGNLTYESIMKMKFIDLCIKETLRKYPATNILNRECTKEYQITGSKFIIQKGTPIIFSLLGLHRDAKYFPEPEKYDPDRFTDEKHTYDEDMYMPFGAGPRNCIGKVDLMKFQGLTQKYYTKTLQLSEWGF
jgi:cytochrome P450 family 6